MRPKYRYKFILFLSNFCSFVMYKPKNPIHSQVILNFYSSWSIFVCNSATNVLSVFNFFLHKNDV